MDFTAILVPKMPILIQVMMAWLLFVSTTTAFSVQIPQHSRVTTTVQAPLQRSSSSTSTALEMASGGALSCRPIGIGSAVPATRLTNAELESVVETTDEWIQTRTGIAARRVLVTQSSANDATATAENADAPLQSSERLSDLSIAAARNALQMANIDATDISVLICCTSSPDDLFGDAPTIAAALGCTTDTVAFDLTAACSGFLFGMVTAGHFLTVPTTSSSAPRRALVIGADALSRWVDWDDRNACILFGDGAGAMVLEACETTPTSNVKDSFGILGFATHSNGNGHGDLKLEYTGSPRKIATPGEGTVLSSGSYGKMYMNGKEVYKFATSRVPEVLQECLTAADMTVDQVDWLLLHQANRRIMESVASKLGIPMEKVICNLQDYGNTSAASIPLALDEAVRSGKVKSGDIIACAGFGAGLSWGSAILRWS